MDVLSSVPVDPWILFAGVVFLFFVVFVPFFMNLLSGWRKPLDAVNSPMTVTLHTEKTPAQLNSAARFARFKRNLFWVGFVAVSWALLHVVNYDLAISIDEVVFSVLGTLFGALSKGLAAVSDILTSFS